MEISAESRTELIEWCQYHYQDNLAGLALFDPEPVRSDYPRGDINVLLLLHNTPAEERKRYDGSLRIQGVYSYTILLANLKLRARVS
ncbi:MAG: hypothetical protein GY796_27475 [Chloroflexi bacterium]|nr:hypothetical protein [Chloroflexota bacterium]